MKVRITKYDPKLRSEDGAFRGTDWTSISDIGKFSGLTVEEYLKTEDKYWKTLMSILSFLGVTEMRIGSVVFYDNQQLNDNLSAEAWKFCRDLTLKELSCCRIETAEKLFRAALREVISFQAFLSSDHSFCAECGYDLYLYVEASADFKWIEVPGIFVEVIQTDIQ